MKVGIIGAGFAGVAAAQVIAQEGVKVTLFSAEKVPPYFRPRLPEFAFGQEEPDNIFINKPEWYAEKGIDLRLDTAVTAFTHDFEISLKDGSKEKFDALVIAIGGGPIIPAFARGSGAKNVFPLWNYSDALEIRKRVKAGKRMVVIGGGIIGIESALRAEDKDLKITVIEKMPHLMSRNFGEKASEVIEAQLRERNINLELAAGVTAIENTADDMLKVELEGGKSLTGDFVLLSIGTGFELAMSEQAGVKADRRILVDGHLRTSVDGIFAAGDIAQFTQPIPCSAKEAMVQGKIAANNVLSYLNGGDLQIYEVPPVPVRLKYEDFELHSIGKVPSCGEQENILDFESMKVYRGCVYENSVLTGVQMVGSGKDFMKYQKEILQEGKQHVQ